MAYSENTPIERRRVRATVTVDPNIYKRIKKIVDAGKRESVSAIIEEMALGYLHIIEHDCGPEFIQSDRLNRRVLPALFKMFSVLVDGAKIGEAAALAYDKKFVQQELRELAPTVDPDDEEDEEPAQRPAKKSKKSTKKNK
ncbi:MAG: ribbon-helix-helix protein, CopG family [Thermoguttaceae bacterium]|nr:ribbon-helix-helix protein, CopG family [Thermoguttaceae bacterium]MBQ8362699.1 ribbon-helix-helix protein, CopG family [Thermoguttaceae bacterium]